MNNEISKETFDLPALCQGKPQHFAAGIYENVPRHVYDNIPALSATVIKKWIHLGLASEFGYWLKSRWDEEPSEALTTGLALDTLLLEPGEFAKKFISVPPEAPKRPSVAQRFAKKPSPETLRAIGFWNKFNEQCEGRTVLTSDQIDTVNKVAKALKGSPSLAGVFENCKKTVLVGEVFGWPAKCEIDLFSKKTEHVLDLKTAADVSPAGFAVACDRFGYIDQAVWYLLICQSLGLKKTAFDFVAAKTGDPYPVQVYTFDRNITEHETVFQGTVAKLKRAHSSCLFSILEGAFQDPQDWTALYFAPWTLSRAEREINGDWS